MPNTYTRGTAKDYPRAHNDREKKVLETVFSDTTQGVSELAAAAADYAITSTDGYDTFIVNDDITITMPPVAANAGRKLQFILIAAAVLTIGQNADDANIGGADADYTTLDAATDRAEFVSDGLQWLIVSSTIAA